MEIKIIKGDITKLEVEAIVNAANPSLLGPAVAKKLAGLMARYIGRLGRSCWQNARD